MIEKVLSVLQGPLTAVQKDRQLSTCWPEEKLFKEGIDANQTDDLRA